MKQLNIFGGADIVDTSKKKEKKPFVFFRHERAELVEVFRQDYVVMLELEGVPFDPGDYRRFLHAQLDHAAKSCNSKGEID